MRFEYRIYKTSFSFTKSLGDTQYFLHFIDDKTETERGAKRFALDCIDNKAAWLAFNLRIGNKPIFLMVKHL